MRSKPMILVALLLAAFLVNLDTTLVNVALPAMVRQLRATHYSAAVGRRRLQPRVRRSAAHLPAACRTGSAARACCWRVWPWSGPPSLAGGFTTRPSATHRGQGRDGAGRRHDVPGDPLADLQRLHGEKGTGPGPSACGVQSRAWPSPWGRSLGAGCSSTTAGPAPSSSPWRRSRRSTAILAAFAVPTFEGPGRGGSGHHPA